MKQKGPVLERLTRRLAECPPEFLAEPRTGDKGVVHAAAVVSDLMQDLGGSFLAKEKANVFQGQNNDARARNRLRLILIAAWLLHDAWFREKKMFADAACDFLSTGLDDAASVVEASKFVSDPDRREELARLCLHDMGFYPEGESEAQALDRLTTLSSVERRRLVKETKKSRDRVNQILEAMRKKAAEEAAASYNRE